MNIEDIFYQSTFIQRLGIELVGYDAGWCETKLVVQPSQQQQDGFVHAGVQTILADHTAGAAAATLMPAGKRVLTVEFKVNFLRPGLADHLTCRAEVLKAGRQLSVAESFVYGIIGEQSKLIAKATVTLAIVDAQTN